MFFYISYISSFWPAINNNYKHHNRFEKTTAEKIKSSASEIANNSTGIINPNEAKNILNQLGEAYKKNSVIWS
ncbi:MAG TPA: hypothetical protein VJ697_07690 [Nitrososphaeraceae archaeon]|nr:hypothetical protein [Nitrososphaeraceae archaeon]